MITANMAAMPTIARRTRLTLTARRGFSSLMEPNASITGRIRSRLSGSLLRLNTL